MDAGSLSPLEPVFDGGAQSDAGTADARPASAALVLARPYRFHVPVRYEPGKPTPLVILLHGYSASGESQDSYFQLTTLSDERTFLYAAPDGTLDSAGERFWNVTDACCNFAGKPIDDVAYLNAVIDDVQSKYTVDSKRIFLIGHSNGGFMAHRFACDQADRIAGIATLAGAQWKDASRCQPTQRPAVLALHGTLDNIIYYLGGTTGIGTGKGQYPSANETVTDWAQLNGCTHFGQAFPNLDLDTGPGAETQIRRYSGCAGGAVELWTMDGAGHIPSFRSGFAASVYDFLMAHPKP